MKVGKHCCYVFLPFLLTNWKQTSASNQTLNPFLRFSATHCFNEKHKVKVPLLHYFDGVTAVTPSTPTVCWELCAFPCADEESQRHLSGFLKKNEFVLTGRRVELRRLSGSLNQGADLIDQLTSHQATSITADSAFLLSLCRYNSSWICRHWHSSRISPGGNSLPCSLL